MITAQLCTIPEREQSLRLTIDSLVSQVDILTVMLNGFNIGVVEAFRMTENMEGGESIVFIKRTNDLTDANKFWGIENVEGYVIICDDDLIYPPTYVQDMIKAVDKYKCIVSLHGRTYKKPFKDFYTMERNYRCLGNVLHDAEVDICGSGVMAYHTDFFKLNYSDFTEPNMADVFVSKIAHEQGVKMMVLKHKSNYLVHTVHKETIFQTENRKKFIKQTEILKTFL